jgi:DNA-binding GntR family transcriptional regulator
MRHASEKTQRTAPSRLQRELADRILRLLHEDGAERGSRLNENALARRLNVSRTPIRASLDHLAALGVVARRQNRGVEVVGELPLPAEKGDPSDDDDLFIRMARDRESGALRDQPSETELMRLYDLSRPAVQRVLRRLSDLGLVERKPGHGWRFQPTTVDEAIRAESYRFRLLIEPAGLLEPSFGADANWLAEMKTRHLETIEKPWLDTSSVAFFDMNASFHEGLAKASGNRFIFSAIQQQSHLRRFANYNWLYGFERVVGSCREHLEIIDRLADGENELAAALMRRHLQRSRALRRPSSILS